MASASDLKTEICEALDGTVQSVTDVLSDSSKDPDEARTIIFDAIAGAIQAHLNNNYTLMEGSLTGTLTVTAGGATSDYPAGATATVTYGSADLLSKEIKNASTGEGKTATDMLSGVTSWIKTNTIATVDGVQTTELTLTKLGGAPTIPKACTIGSMTASMSDKPETREEAWQVIADAIYAKLDSMEIPVTEAAAVGGLGEGVTFALGAGDIKLVVSS